jgi:hypothetical protein
VDGQRGQHVIEETDAGGHAVLAAAVQVEGYADVRLTGPPLYSCLSFNHDPLSQKKPQITQISQITEK